MHYEKKADEKFYHLIGKRVALNGSDFLHTMPHFHDSYEMLFVLDGVVDFVVNGESKKIGKGEIFFSGGYDIHSFNTENCKAYTLVFSKSYCEFFANEDYTFENFLKPNYNVFLDLYNLIESNYNKYGEFLPNKLLAESLISYVLGTLNENVKKVAKNKDKAKDVMISVMQYINDNFDKDLTMPEIAKEFGYSPNHFSTIFNRFTTMSFNDYLNYVRVGEFVKISNQQPNLTVTEVANMCGFGSMNTFYRAKQKYL